MESIPRLNILEEKISSLLQIASKLKEENDRLTKENSLLKGEAAQLKEELNTAENSTGQYLSERDAVIERLESLITKLDKAHFWD